MSERLPKDLSKWEKKVIIEDIGSPEEHGDPFWRKGNFGLEMDADETWEAYAIIDGIPIKIKGDFMSSGEAIEFLNASMCRKELVEQDDVPNEEEVVIEVEIMDDAPSFREIMAKSMAEKYGNDFEKSGASTGITVDIDNVRGPNGSNTGATPVANPDDVRKSEEFPTFSQMFGRNVAKASEDKEEKDDEKEEETEEVEETTEETSDDSGSEETEEESETEEVEEDIPDEGGESDVPFEEDISDEGEIPEEGPVEESIDITAEEPALPDAPAEPAAPMAAPKTEVSTWVGRTVSFSNVGKTGVIPAPQLAASAPPVAPPVAQPQTGMPSAAQLQATPAPAPAPAQEPAQMSSQGGFDPNAKLAPIPPIGAGVVQKASGGGTFDDALDAAPKSFRDEVNARMIINQTRNGTAEGMVPFGAPVMNMGSPVMQTQYLPGTVRMNYMGPSNMTFPNDRLQSRQG